MNRRVDNKGGTGDGKSFSADLVKLLNVNKSPLKSFNASKKACETYDLKRLADSYPLDKQAQEVVRSPKPRTRYLRIPSDLFPSLASIDEKNSAEVEPEKENYEPYRCSSNDDAVRDTSKILTLPKGVADVKKISNFGDENVIFNFSPKKMIESNFKKDVCFVKNETSDIKPDSNEVNPELNNKHEIKNDVPNETNERKEFAFFSGETRHDGPTSPPLPTVKTQEKQEICKEGILKTELTKIWNNCFRSNSQNNQEIKKAFENFKKKLDNTKDEGKSETSDQKNILNNSLADRISKSENQKGAILSENDKFKITRDLCEKLRMLTNKTDLARKSNEKQPVQNTQPSKDKKSNDQTKRHSAEEKPTHSILRPSLSSRSTSNLKASLDAKKCSSQSSQMKTFLHNMHLDKHKVSTIKSSSSSLILSSDESEKIKRASSTERVTKYTDILTSSQYMSQNKKSSLNHVTSYEEKLLGRLQKIKDKRDKSKLKTEHKMTEQVPHLPKAKSKDKSLQVNLPLPEVKLFDRALPARNNLKEVVSGNGKNIKNIHTVYYTNARREVESLMSNRIKLNFNASYIANDDSVNIRNTSQIHPKSNFIVKEKQFCGRGFDRSNNGNHVNFDRKGVGVQDSGTTCDDLDDMFNDVCNDNFNNKIPKKKDNQRELMDENYLDYLSETLSNVIKRFSRITQNDNSSPTRAPLLFTKPEFDKSYQSEKRSISPAENRDYEDYKELLKNLNANFFKNVEKIKSQHQDIYEKLRSCRSPENREPKNFNRNQGGDFYSENKNKNNFSPVRKEKYYNGYENKNKFFGSYGRCEPYEPPMMPPRYNDYPPSFGNNFQYYQKPDEENIDVRRLEDNSPFSFYRSASPSNLRFKKANNYPPTDYTFPLTSRGQAPDRFSPPLVPCNIPNSRSKKMFFADFNNVCDELHQKKSQVVSDHIRSAPKLIPNHLSRLDNNQRMNPQSKMGVDLSSRNKVFSSLDSRICPYKKPGNPTQNSLDPFKVYRPDAYG